MILRMTGKVIKAYASKTNGNLYLTLADADSLTQLKVMSERVGMDEVQPHMDELRVIEAEVKASTFVSQERGEQQTLEVLRIRFSPVGEAAKTPVKQPA